MDQARLRGSHTGCGRGAVIAALFTAGVLVVGALVIIAATGGATG
jgi:hypothetical protein